MIPLNVRHKCKVTVCTLKINRNNRNCTDKSHQMIQEIHNKTSQHQCFALSVRRQGTLSIDIAHQSNVHSMRGAYHTIIKQGHEVQESPEPRCYQHKNAHKIHEEYLDPRTTMP